MDLVRDLLEGNTLLLNTTTSGLLPFNGKVPVGEYFITDGNENEINLCQKTNRKHKNADLVSKPFRVIATLVFNCDKQYGQVLKGTWQIPWHLINWVE